MPLVNASCQFNPQTLQPLGDVGTVWPELRLTAGWEALDVQGGALLDQTGKVAVVSAVGIDATAVSGDGWRLPLKPGRAIRPDARRGDLVLEETGRR